MHQKKACKDFLAVYGKGIWWSLCLCTHRKGLSKFKYISWRAEHDMGTMCWTEMHSKNDSKLCFKWRGVLFSQTPCRTAKELKGALARVSRRDSWHSRPTSQRVNTRRPKPHAIHTEGFPSKSGIFRGWCTNFQNLLGKREARHIHHPQDSSGDVQNGFLWGWCADCEVRQYHVTGRVREWSSILLTRCVSSPLAPSGSMDCNLGAQSKMLPHPICRNLLGIFGVKFLDAFARQFPRGCLVACPTEMMRKQPVAQSPWNKSGSSKWRSAKNPFG